MQLGDVNDLAVSLEVRYCTQSDMPGMIRTQTTEKPEAVSITLASGQRRPPQPVPENAGQLFDDMMRRQNQPHTGADYSKLTVSCSHLFSQSNGVPYVWMISCDHNSRDPACAAVDGPDARRAGRF